MLEAQKEEQLIVYDYEPVTGSWSEKTAVVKIAPEPFSKGAMRAAYRMSDCGAVGVCWTVLFVLSTGRANEEHGV